MKTIEKLCTYTSTSTILQDKGLHFEQLQGFKNRKTTVYSARVDQGYRLIMLRGQDRSSPYYIYFIGKHDEANSWALSHDLVINPRTGGLQLLVCPEITILPNRGKGPLSAIRPAHWYRLGLPVNFIPQVQNLYHIGDEKELEGLILPQTIEAIQYLLVNCSLEEVLELYGIQKTDCNNQPGLFDGVSEEDLLDLGIPEAYLNKVYDLTTEDELEELQEELPVEAYESLFFLNCGFGVEEILDAYDRVRGQKIDTDDYLKALTNPDSKRAHVPIPQGEQASRFLEDSLEAWRIFLHQNQRKMVESEQTGPSLVLGGAGTGKTVVAMHRAKWLAEMVCKTGERVLFTTFNVNLAQDISNNMDKLCGQNIREMITVTSIDKWVRGYLTERGFQKNLEYWPSGIQLKNCFEKALQMVPLAKNLDKDMLYREWENVFQPWDFKGAADYIRFRSTWEELPYMERKMLLVIYEFFSAYQNFLNQKGIVDFGGALIAAINIAEKEPPIFRSIIVDEAQDMRPGTWMLLRNLVKKDKNDLFIVGDPAQRIGTAYSELSRCGIDVEGRVEHLRLNYRNYSVALPI